MKNTLILLCLFVIATGCRRSADGPQADKSETNLISGLEQDIALLDKQILGAQDDLIEYSRLHDINRIQIRAEAERQQLAAFGTERMKVEQEILVLEATYPSLKDTNTITTVQDSNRDRHKELMRTLKVLEASEYNWKAKNLLAVMRDSELKHLQDRVRRLEETYSQLAQCLHEVRMKEQLKSLQNQPSDRTR